MPKTLIQNHENCNHARYSTMFVIFLLSSLTFIIAPIRTPFDSFFTIHTAYSLLHGEWGNLAQFVNINPTHHAIGIAKDGMPYSVYPVGPSLFAIPFVAIADALTPDFGLLLQTSTVSIEFEALTVAFWCAVATAMMFRLAAETTRSVNIGFAAAFIFAFCSPILSTATRALWQHGPVVVCFLSTFLMLRAAERRPNLVVWAALPVALAFVCRPLTIPFVVAVTVFIAVYHRRLLVRFVLAGAVIAVLWMLYNYAVWGHVFPPSYRPSSFEAASVPWIEKFLGSLISPSRGFLVYSPIFLFSLVGVMLKLRARTLDRFDALCIAVVLGHIGIIAISPTWWAGHSYGSRFMTDVVPLLVYLMLPALQAVTTPLSGTWRQVGAVVMLFLGAISFLISEKGALTMQPYLWNSEPNNIDGGEGRKRLWAWRDFQFLRGTALEHGHPSIQAMRLLAVRHAPPLAPGRIIDLSVNGEWGGALISGWSTPENWGVWSNGSEAHLRLALQPETSSDIVLNCEAQAFVTEHHPSITVKVMAANEVVGTWQFDTQSPAGIKSLTIPRRLLADETLDLTFLIESPQSPHALGISADGRLLGVGLRKIGVLQTKL